MPFYLVNADQEGARVLGTAISKHTSVGLAVADLRARNDDWSRRGFPVPSIAIVETADELPLGATVLAETLIRRFSADGKPC